MNIRHYFWKINDARYYFFQDIKLYWHYRINVMTSVKTIEYIQKNRCSIARFGNDELDIVVGEKLKSFQRSSPELQRKLYDVLNNRPENLLVCMPRYMNDMQGCRKEAKTFWRNWRRIHQIPAVRLLRSTLGNDYLYGDAEMTRPYIDYTSPRNANLIFPKLKELWNGRELLIVEGKQTCLGVGNDLFIGAKTIKRIVCPPTNAFDYYEKILLSIKKEWDGELVLLALGATATVLASDLAKCGIQALDIGHVDIEYEWMKMNAQWKCAIPGKYTNEVESGRAPLACEDITYISQIVQSIGD